MVTGACAGTAGSKDSENLAGILEQTMANLRLNELKIDQITADGGYSSGKALKYCEENGIDAYTPNFGQYKPTRAGFVYNKELDEYECIQAGGNGAILPFKGIKTDSKGSEIKHYRSSGSSCKACPLRESCCGKVTKFKKLVENIHKPYYDRMHEKLSSNRAYATKISKIRSRPVEPVLGTLINFLNMKKINSRGMAQANKHVLMSALMYDLRKYLKFERKKVVIKAQELPQVELFFALLQNWCFRASFQPV